MDSQQNNAFLVNETVDIFSDSATASRTQRHPDDRAARRSGKRTQDMVSLAAENDTSYGKRALQDGTGQNYLNVQIRGE
ncbi:hypothetical protein ACOZVK_003784 [Cronobacter sakazakii]